MMSIFTLCAIRYLLPCSHEGNSEKSLFLRNDSSVNRMVTGLHFSEEGFFRRSLEASSDRETVVIAIEEVSHDIRE